MQSIEEMQSEIDRLNSELDRIKSYFDVRYHVGQELQILYFGDRDDRPRFMFYGMRVLSSIAAKNKHTEYAVRALITELSKVVDDIRLNPDQSYRYFSGANLQCEPDEKKAE